MGLDPQAAAGTPDLLEAIVAATRRSVDVRRGHTSARELAAGATRTPRGDEFRRRLARPDVVNVIAECKRRSPSRGVLVANYDPVDIASRYEAGGAAAVSVLTEPTFFDGSLDHLAAVREAVTVPLLRKDFIVDEYQLLEAQVAGADAVLLIVAALDDPALATLMRAAGDLGLACLVEVHDDVELDRALGAGAHIIGVNNRNLRTLQTDTTVSAGLIARIPDSVVAVAESGLRSPEDVAALRTAGYCAFLVGEGVVQAADPGDAVRALMTAGRSLTT